MLDVVCEGTFVIHHDSQISKALLDLYKILTVRSKVVGGYFQFFIAAIPHHFEFVAVKEHVIFLLPAIYYIKITLEILHILFTAYGFHHAGVISEEGDLAIGDILVDIIDHD